MKAIIINDNSVDDEFKNTKLVRVRDVLELIDKIETTGNTTIPGFKQKLKERIKE